MRATMINFSIPKALLQLLDKQAKNELKTRSELLRDAIRAYLIHRNQWNEVFSYGQKQAKKLKISPSDVESTIDEYRQGK
jgi:metal-responsive CopG/Arc/MetJ family transcriptional regulator